jgi:hypothetical protein
MVSCGIDSIGWVTWMKTLRVSEVTPSYNIVIFFKQFEQYYSIFRNVIFSLAIGASVF